MVRERATLKTFFETGDYPTQAEFEDLIDSLWHKTDDRARLFDLRHNPSCDYIEGEVTLKDGLMYVSNQNQPLGAFNPAKWDVVRLASVSWVDISGKPTGFPPIAHNHDDRYYTDAEVDALFASIDLGGALKTDGSNSPTADIDWGGYNIKKLRYIRWDSLYDYIDCLNGFLMDGLDKVSVNWGSRLLYDINGAGSIEWGQYRIMYNSNAGRVLNWEYSELFDDAENLSLNWATRNLIDENGYPSAHWSERTLTDFVDTVSVDWSDRNLTDNTNRLSIDWNNRVCQNSSEDTTLDWESAKLINGKVIRHTSGASLTVTRDIDAIYVDPISTLPILEIIMPTNPREGEEYRLSFGGTITLGVVVTSVQFQDTIQSVLFSSRFKSVSGEISVNAGDSFIFKYDAQSILWRII